MHLRRVFARKSRCFADVISLFYAHAHMRFVRKCASKKIGRKKNFESDGMRLAIIAAYRAVMSESMTRITPVSIFLEYKFWARGIHI